MSANVFKSRRFDYIGSAMASISSIERPAPRPCPICGKPLVERRGRYGPFKSCSDYPKCPGPKGVKKAEKVEV